MRTIKIRCGHGIEEVYGDLATPWKDKHGRQIYEGDTVIARLPYDDKPKRLRAVFSYVRGFRLEDMDADDGRTACHSVANAQCWDMEIVDPKPEAPANKCADCPFMKDPSNITDDKWSER